MYLTIGTLCKPISKDFAPVIKTEIMVPFLKVWLWNKLKSFDVLSFIRFQADFLIGKFEETFYFPSALVFIAIC